MADVGSESVRAELERLLANEKFAHSQSLSRFLRFTVEQAIQGHCDRLKEYVLGVEVFERGDAFDPRVDPIVRVQAGNLRHRLQEYYRGEGRDDPVLIEFPVGGYVPVFRSREAAARKPARAWRRAALWGGLAVAAAATAWWLLRTRPPEPWAPLTQLTFAASGSAAFPAISRDGRLLAYASDD